VNLKAPFEIEPSSMTLRVDYHDLPDENPVLKRNLETKMIFVKGSWGSVFYNLTEYKMYGFYIHHPSEHTVS
jgi:hypothetical protein